jgi:hypothetical protein
MTRDKAVKKAIFNMGGPKLAGSDLQVSTSTISKWIRNGVIPKLDQARKVASASGFDIALLRPRFEQHMI